MEGHEFHKDHYLHIVNGSATDVFYCLNFASKVLEQKRFIAKFAKAYKKEIIKIKKMVETKTLIAYSLMYWEDEELF